jgi:hypothetical protein
MHCSQFSSICACPQPCRRMSAHVEYQAYVHSQQCASAGKTSEMFTYEALWTSNACLTNSLQRRFPCKSCASFTWHQASFPPLLMPCPHTKVHLFAFFPYIIFLYARENCCQCHAVFQQCLLIRKRSVPMIATAPQENSEEGCLTFLALGIIPHVIGVVWYRGGSGSVETALHPRADRSAWR